jgi:Raf kinase inhibitor-like YbhB/YbcL family protein
MKLLSSAFVDGSTIPKKYGYKFDNINPPLKIENIPENTKSLVLIMDDPDALPAVGKIWVHWIIWNILPNITEIPENSIPIDSVEGLTDFGKIGYGGPSPPDKEHTYFFKLYAINKKLDLIEGTSKNDIENAIKENIIEQCFLKGKFSPQ